MHHLLIQKGAHPANPSGFFPALLLCESLMGRSSLYPGRRPSPCLDKVLHGLQSLEELASGWLHTAVRHYQKNKRKFLLVRGGPSSQYMVSIFSLLTNCLCNLKIWIQISNGSLSRKPRKVWGLSIPGPPASVGLPQPQQPQFIGMCSRTHARWPSLGTCSQQVCNGTVYQSTLQTPRRSEANTCRRALLQKGVIHSCKSPMGIWSSQRGENQKYEGR